MSLDGMTREEAHGFEVVDHESGFFTIKFGESVEGRDLIAHLLVDNPEGTTDLAVYAVTHGTETQMLRWVDYWMTPGYVSQPHPSPLRDSECQSGWSRLAEAWHRAQRKWCEPQ